MTRQRIIAAAILAGGVYSFPAIAGNLGSYAGGLNALKERNQQIQSDTQAIQAEQSDRRLAGAMDSTGQGSAAPEAKNPAREVCVALGNDWDAATATCRKDYQQACADLGGSWSNSSCGIASSGGASAPAPAPAPIKYSWITRSKSGAATSSGIYTREQELKAVIRGVCNTKGASPSVVDWVVTWEVTGRAVGTSTVKGRCQYR